ncbi:Uncharacterized protein APZ42_030369 [Daphnia magna]|uniref:Tyr recombinase domain-containing protein n=1 Tax=Daphnia magna TaxID=35525 RepID=A0A164NU01_9CRUS|nr:Uncharacterized protein APZ42_030369 [Daphnia magna]
MRGFSATVVDLLMAGNRPNTHSTYESAWRKWMDWCLGRRSNPLSNDLGEALEFLSHLHSSGMSYSSINIHRSMLSSTLDPVDGLRIGEHPVEVKLLKGCFNQNPPRPKYSVTWDPSKAATLVALATLMRVSEIAAIEFKSVTFSQNGVKFSLDSLRKAQRSGPLQTFSLSGCPDPKVCPVKTLKEYIERTNEFRTEANCSRLLVAVIPPHKPVSSNTVSRWIRSVLNNAGVDTDVFGANSTRGAAASKAAVSGLSIEAILRAGSWARESTFRRFYNRSAEPTFESAVFGQTHN